MVRLGALFACLLAAVGAHRPGDEVCVMSNNNTCSLDNLTISKTDASTLIYPGGKTRCAFDNFSSRYFKTNATYFFQVFPKKESTKLLIYFQQGGACNSNQTCNFASQCSLPKRTFQVNAIAQSSGILNAFNPDNLFHDWNIVHIPYCTGDIHIGNTITKTKDFKFLLLRDACRGKNMTMHMNGYENAKSALNWALSNYPNPDHLVVAGSSAGALGAQLLAEKIATMWKVKEKKTKHAVIADSYVGVFPHGKTTGALINYFNACNVLPTSIQEECKDGSATSVEIMQEILRNTFFSDWLHITSQGDWVQRFFTKLLDVGLDRSVLLNHLDPTKFFIEMNTIIMGEKEASTRMSAFFVEGSKHIFLLDDDWYETKRAGTEETLGAFLKAWLGNGANGNVTAIAPVVLSTRTPMPASS